MLREEVVRRSTTGEHLTVQLEEVRSALKDSQEEIWSLQAELLQLACQTIKGKKGEIA
ncbi:hypothetical protein [Photorhabdus laumondii]|uniref:hypothetical protein n=1 Tax=Photorhabdus laumondii TaxID=2218628 RepID=UPI000321898B|nr:hypothetical protein [Photorhabdus laumondii]